MTNIRQVHVCFSQLLANRLFYCCFSCLGCRHVTQHVVGRLGRLVPDWSSAYTNRHTHNWSSGVHPNQTGQRERVQVQATRKLEAAAPCLAWTSDDSSNVVLLTTRDKARDKIYETPQVDIIRQAGCRRGSKRARTVRSGRPGAREPARSVLARRWKCTLTSCSWRYSCAVGALVDAPAPPPPRTSSNRSIFDTYLTCLQAGKQ